MKNEKFPAIICSEGVGVIKTVTTTIPELKVILESKKWFLMHAYISVNEKIAEKLKIEKVTEDGETFYRSKVLSEHFRKIKESESESESDDGIEYNEDEEEEFDVDAAFDELDDDDFDLGGKKRKSNFLLETIVSDDEEYDDDEDEEICVPRTNPSKFSESEIREMLGKMSKEEIIDEYVKMVLRLEDKSKQISNSIFP